MNQVRDEFFGQIYVLSGLQDEDYWLAIGGEMKNVNNDLGFMNDPEDFIYEIQYIKVKDLAKRQDITVMTPTYDIPDNYLGTQLGS